MARSAIVALIIVLIALGLVAAFAPDRFYDGMAKDAVVTSVVRTALVGLLVGGAFFSAVRSDLRQALKHALVWVVIVFGLIATYQIKHDVGAVFSSADSEEEGNVERVLDFRPEAPGPRAASLRREADGHYWADAKVDGARIKFMIDTGASTVALSPRDAARIGFNLDELDFSWRVSTAGGQTFGASVLIDEIQIGNVRVENIEAMVLQEDLDISLLGMTFLNELYSYEFRGNNLILRQ